MEAQHFFLWVSCSLVEEHSGIFINICCLIPCEAPLLLCDKKAQNFLHKLFIETREILSYHLCISLPEGDFPLISMLV